MKKEMLEFNLATMNEKAMIKMLNDNNADIPELMALLEALFDMWSSALKFSSVVVQYGETRHDNFLTIFIKNAAPAHGISPERLAKALKMIKQPNPIIH